MDDRPMADQAAPTQAELLAAVRRAWAEVLDLDSPDRVDLDVKFLEAGGSSLLLIMLWEELHPLTARTLKVSDLFQHSTVRAQVALLAGEDDAPPKETAAAGTGATERGRLLGLARRAESGAGGAA